MSSLPKLRQPLKRDNYNDRVRFSKESKLSDAEKHERSKSAYEFLNPESSSREGMSSRLRSSSPLRSSYTTPVGRSSVLSSGKTNSDSLRSILKRSSNYQEKKPYQLMGESPIRNVSGLNPLRADSILNSLKSRPYNPSNLSSSSTTSSRVGKPSSSKKPSSKQHGALFNSLSSLGSKILSSVLYNESENLEPANEKPTIPNNLERSALSSWNSRELHGLTDMHNTPQRSLDSEIQLKRRELESLEKEIQMKRNEKEIELKRLESDLALKRQQRELSASEDTTPFRSTTSSDFVAGGNVEDLIKSWASVSQETVLKELGSVKDEVLNLRKRQERNNIEFEARLEAVKHERELNRRSFEKLMSELEEKRSELDEEKDKYIRLLHKQSRKRKYTRDDSSDDESNSDTAAGYERDGFKRRSTGDSRIHNKIIKLVDQMKDVQKVIQDNVKDTKQVNNVF
ncbi:hypothetical protein CANARDRAFT_27132 [[Candida] arabinofermentans NRRL YB-2248]|uniref:Uncharacterized protein n=1 Tax=[Candida] arabinofermentans NRRL YB-2248 TaxID=983967 RepID=A0A1E4T4X2_9ASCO|nr:hypothetical protein CANARDRAFT_27132 [[Candida] arabinofermentans NRRL YB-2248]